QLSKSLSAMHAKPEYEWSLDALAQIAAMSRSTFAESFRREVGQTPGEYLTQWRITTAQALLRRGTPLKLVGERVGYGSQTGFIRAFKRALGCRPKSGCAKLGLHLETLLFEVSTGDGPRFCRFASLMTRAERPLISFVDIGR